MRKSHLNLHVVIRSSPVPLLVVLAAGPANRCRLATESGTGELHLSGTIHFLRADQGCWQLEASDGGRYQLEAEQAPPSVLVDGASVRVVVRLSERDASGCEVGLPVDVRRVVSVE
jgi:hypothetical protein